MNKNTKYMYSRFPVIIFILGLFLISCNTRHREQENEYELAVSILPQKYFIDRITGNTVRTLVMIPESASPATYEPMPSQVQALSRVKAYFRIGYIGYELAWMDKLRETNPGMKVVDLSDGIDLIEGESTHEEEEHESSHHHSVDPHIWMSPANCLVMSKNILNTLIVLFPEQKKAYRDNYSVLRKDIEATNRMIDSTLKSCDQRVFLIFHPALTYYARDYQLVQVPIEMDGNEPSLKHMAEIMQMIKSSGIKDIFIQQQFDRKNAEALVKETGGDILVINPLDYYWNEQILDITHKMQEALK